MRKLLNTLVFVTLRDRTIMLLFIMGLLLAVLVGFLLWRNKHRSQLASQKQAAEQKAQAAEQQAAAKRAGKQSAHHELLDQAENGEIKAIEMLYNQWGQWGHSTEAGVRKPKPDFGHGSAELQARFTKLWPFIVTEHEYIIWRPNITKLLGAWREGPDNPLALLGLLRYLLGRQEVNRQRFAVEFEFNLDSLKAELAQLLQAKLRQRTSAASTHQAVLGLLAFVHSFKDFTFTLEALEIPQPKLPPNWNELVDAYVREPSFEFYIGLRPRSDLARGELHRRAGRAVVNGDVGEAKRILATIRTGCGHHQKQTDHELTYFPHCKTCPQAREEVGDYLYGLLGIVVGTERPALQVAQSVE